MAKEPATGRLPPLPMAEPPKYDKADIYALKALQEGIATEAQQKRSLAWILKDACGIDRDPFRPDNARLSEHLVGRQSVGRAMLELINARTAIIND